MMTTFECWMPVGMELLFLYMSTTLGAKLRAIRLNDGGIAMSSIGGIAGLSARRGATNTNFFRCSALVYVYYIAIGRALVLM